MKLEYLAAFFLALGFATYFYVEMRLLKRSFLEAIGLKRNRPH